MTTTTTPTTVRCDLCKYWRRYMGEVKGQCLALPPTPYAMSGSALPETAQNHPGCIYFIAREVAQPEAVKVKVKK